MKKAKKIFLNILFYLSLIAFLFSIASAFAVLSNQNQATSTLWVLAIPSFFLPLILSIIPFINRKRNILFPWQVNTTEVIFLISFGILLSFIITISITAGSPISSAIPDVSLSLLPLVLFIVTCIVGLLLFFILYMRLLPFI
jgi:hypothetical protein